MSKSPITTRTKLRIPRDPNRRPPPMHPGEILREEFMVPSGLTANALALALRVPATRISEILRERRSITAETAYRLAIYFGTSVELWTNLQTSFEISLVEAQKLDQIKREVQKRSA
jgi:addiction module HigA family antidote